MTRPVHTSVYRAIFTDVNGPLPLPCAACKSLVHRWGRDSEGGVVHHRDHDVENNEPTNLALMHKGCHDREHNTGVVFTAERRQRISAALTSRTLSDEQREKVRQFMTGRPSYERTDEVRELNRRAMQRLKKQCPGCELVTNPGALAGHLKATGHGVGLR